MKLSGRTVLITGAANGLGRELTSQLDSKGCKLLLVDRDVDGLQDLHKILRPHASWCIPCDLTDGEARTRLVSQIRAAERHLDVLIHCAGVGSHSRLKQLTTEEIRQVLQVNTLAPLELTVGLLSLLPPGKPAGVVTIGSLAGELAVPGISLYSASKAALHAFSRAVAAELAYEGHFSLLVILGALRGTRFDRSIRYPLEGQPRWYRMFDTDTGPAASRIIRAIEQRRSRLVIPGWYSGLLALSKLSISLTQAATELSYRKLRETH